jgi:WD40 repeat protein
MAQADLSPTTSLTDRVESIAAGAHVVGGGFLGDVAALALALADGVVLIGDKRVPAHADAAILHAMVANTGIVTGGDDGRVLATDARGESTELGRVSGWIDALASRADGAIAWSSGKTVFARDTAGAIKTTTMPSSARGLAFMAKGYRLAVAHYNGVSLWFPNLTAAPDVLAWKGSHLGVTTSPDGRFVVSAMQENALHGWRLTDKRDMRMSGYPAKTRSLSWSHDGHWLATSGADACIVWPFQTKDGPMGRAPKEVGVRAQRVTCVAFHPAALVVAVGYSDGLVMLCRLEDGAEILVRAKRDDTDGAVSALGWDARGTKLVFGTEGGVAGLVTLPA